MRSAARMRAYRILRKLATYQPIDPIANRTPVLESHMQRLPNETILGIYTNGSAHEADHIVVTARGIAFTHEAAWTLLPYADIHTIVFPHKATDADQLQIIHRQPMRTILTVRGGHDRWRDCYPFGRFLMRVAADTAAEQLRTQPYTIWIEREVSTNPEWCAEDENSDVIVTFANGTRWVATCMTYQNLATLTASNRTSGEYLHGTYFWASDLVLVARLSRTDIQVLIQHVLEHGQFESLFRQIADADPTTAAS